MRAALKRFREKRRVSQLLATHSKIGTCGVLILILNHPGKRWRSKTGRKPPGRNCFSALAAEADAEEEEES